MLFRFTKFVSDGSFLARQLEYMAVIRGAGTALLIRSASAGGSFVALVLLARWMGPEEFGLSSYALAWATLLAIPAGLGLPGVSVRLIPQFKADDDWSRIRGIMSRSLTLTWAAGGTISALGIVTLLVLGRQSVGAYYIPLIIAMLAVPFIATMTLVSETARVFDWLWLAYGRSQLMPPLMLVTIAYIIFQFEDGLSGAAVVAASAAIYGVIALTQIVALVRRLGVRLRAVAAVYETRPWLKIALIMLIAQSFNNVMVHADLIMVGAIMSPFDVAFYNSAVRTAFLVTFLLQAVNVVTAQRLSALYAQQRVEAMQKMLSTMGHWYFWPSLAVTIGIIVLGDLILNLFGDGFDSAYFALVILAMGHLLHAAVGQSAIVLHMTGRSSTCAKVFGLGTGLNIVLNLTLIPILGLVGAAIATACSIVLSNLVLAIIARRQLGLHTSVLLMLMPSWRRLQN